MSLNENEPIQETFRHEHGKNFQYIFKFHIRPNCNMKLLKCLTHKACKPILTFINKCHQLSTHLNFNKYVRCTLNTISHRSITSLTTFEEVGFPYQFQMGRRCWRWACVCEDEFWNFHICVKTLHEVKPFDKKNLNDLCWTNGECLTQDLHFKPTLGFSN